MSVETPLTTRRDRERARRRARRRSIVISTISTVIVIGGLVALHRHQSRVAQRPHDVLLVSGVPPRRSATCSSGFWLDVRMFLIVEVVVLVLGLADRADPHEPRAGAVPAAAARDRVGRRAARRADDPGRVPRRLRRPGARRSRACRPSAVVLGGAALALSYSAYVVRGVPGRDRVGPPEPDRRGAGARPHAAAGDAPGRDLPQAVRRVVPPLLNDFISLQKDVALVSILGPQEAFRVAQVFAASQFNYTPLIAAALLYLCVTIPLTRIVDRMQAARRVARNAARRSALGSSDDRRPGAARRDQGLRRPRGAARGRPRGRRARGGRADRRLGLGQVDAAALHRPARGDRRRRHPASTASAITTPGLDPVPCAGALGLVFQAYNLFPHMSVLENVILGAVQRAADAGRRGAGRAGEQMLGRFGLADRAKEYPDRLSGGQQQRVAIARALVTQPARPAARRGDERARSRARRRGACGHPAAQDGGHDDGHRDPRDGLRPRGRRSGLLSRVRPDRRARTAGADVQRATERADPAVSAPGARSWSRLIHPREYGSMYTL